MEATQTYKSFNSNKSIEELQYNIATAISKLENLSLELKFYNQLMDKPIFKSHTINLYERLVNFKKEINAMNSNRINLLNDLHTYSNHLKIKIECDDLACDNFFIKEYDAIELKIFNFHNEVLALKFKLFQYLDSVLIN